jgi:hypothetical protein
MRRSGAYGVISADMLRISMANTMEWTSSFVCGF